MDTYCIPVAFNVEAESEEAAALALADILAAARLTQTHRREDGADTDAALGPIECWWTPNHRHADGSDRAATLVWKDDERGRHGYAHDLSISR